MFDSVMEYDKFFIGGKWIKLLIFDVIEVCCLVIGEYVGKVLMVVVVDVDVVVVVVCVVFDNGFWFLILLYECVVVIVVVVKMLVECKDLFIKLFVVEIG